MAALTRGSLPSSIYWRRRLVLLTIVLLLVVAVLKIAGHGGGAPQKGMPAASVTRTTPSTTPTPDPETTPTPDPTPTNTQSTDVTPTPTPTPTPTALPTPSGPCSASDVSVVPTVTGAAEGAAVPIVLTLRSTSTPACTWHVSRKSVQVRVATASGTAVWSTVQCPAAVPSSNVVVYRDTPTTVQVSWSARRADADCSTHTAWSKPGSYQVTAVALGGEPAQASFTLGQPLPPTPPTPSTTAPATPPSSPPASAPAATPPASTTASTSATSPASPPATPSKGKKHKKHKLIQD